MILGIGIDVVELDRIQGLWQRFGERFSARILTDLELRELPQHAESNVIAFLAARFAAKEAGAKALGTGFRQGVGLKSIETLSLPSGKPVLHLHGAAASLAQGMGVGGSHVSLTHGRDVAAAVVILET
jgi:holo-[acyl-carrier protein] synthase